MKTNLALSLALIVGCLFSGCAGVKNSMRPSEKRSHWNPITRLTDKEKAKKNKKKELPPETMAVIWSDSVLEKPGTPPVKGFGGRFYFYDVDNKAVKADGELVVYGFDDSDESRANKAPQADRKFVFPAEQLQSHFSETDLGPSYSFWVPWEKVGGDRKTITLIPVFKSAEGMVLKSGSSINVLRGKSPDGENNAVVVGGAQSKSAKSTGIQRVGFETNNSQGNGNITTANLNEGVEFNQTRIRTSTINLTPSLATRMALSENATQWPVAPQNGLANQTLDQGAKNSNLVSGRTTASVTSDGNAVALKTDSSQTISAEAETDKPIKRAPTVFGTPGSFR